MAMPRREPMSVRNTLYSPLLQSKRLYSIDFLMYDHDPGEFMVVLVIRHCVNATEATIETAHSIEEDGCEVNACRVQY